LKAGFTLRRLTVVSILSVVAGLQIGAFGVVLETFLSGITALPFSAFVLLMQPIHLAIGIVEGIITAAVLGFVYTMRPEIPQSSVTRTPIAAGISLKKVLLCLGVITVLVGGGLSIFASAYPDGLEWAMEKTLGNAGELEAEGPVFRRAGAIQEATAFMPDYNFPSAGEEGSEGGPHQETTLGTTVAGILGAVLTSILAGAAGYVIYRLKRNRLKTV
jgi:cobalt/nickel transport system permease protein